MAVAKTYQDFTAGLNDTSDPIILAENEAAVLTNASVNDSGILEKARGYTKDHSPFPNDTDSFLRMLVNFRRGTSVDDLLKAALDDGNTNATYKVDLMKSSGSGSSSYIGHTAGTSASFTNGNTAVTGVGTTWLSHLKAGDKIKATSHAASVYGTISSVNNDTSITLSANYAGATAAGVAYTARIILHKDFIPRATVFNNKAIIVNGSEKPMTWDNTTLNKITDADCPTAKFVESHKNRVFMASTASNPSRLFWSAVNDEATWDATSIEDIFPQDNGTIIAIKSFGDSLVILKNNGKIYQVSGGFDQSTAGEPTFIRKVDVGDNIGTIAERTPVVHNDGFLYFVSQTGLYKMDQRMGVEKVTSNLETLFDGANFTLGPTASKAYTYDTKTQWDTGSHDGTKATSDGILQPYYDFYTITDAYKSNLACAIAIDSSNIVHVAYIDSTTLLVKYKQYATNGDVTTETAYTATNALLSVSIDIAPSGVIGIAFIEGGTGVPINVTGKLVERTAGVWGAASQFLAETRNGIAISLKYRSDSLPRVLTDAVEDTKLYRYSGAAWTAGAVMVSGQSGNVSDHVSLQLDGSNNPRAAVQTFSGNTVKVLTSADDGTSWTTVEDFTVNSNYPSSLRLNAAGNLITVSISTTGTLVKRNHTTATTTTLDSDTDCTSPAYAILSDLDYVSYSKTSTKHKFYFNTATITESTGTLGTDYPGDRAFVNNGRVFAAIKFGANANEILVRRIAFSSVWTAPEQSDSTLTAWGTYDIGSQTENGNTILHEVATATVSPANTYTTITNGQVINADPARLVVRNRVTFTLATFALPSIGSVILNFTGTGVDAKQMAAISFNDDLLIAYAETSETANNKVLRMDKAGAFSLLTWPVSTFERYRGRLYGGKSTKGDLLLLDNSYGHDGVAYSMEYRSKEDFLESIEGLKSISKVYVLFKVKSSGTFVFSYRLNSFINSSGSTWTDTTINQTSAADTPGIYELQIGQSARSIQFKVTNTTLDNQVGILGIVVVYKNMTIH